MVPLAVRARVPPIGGPATRVNLFHEFSKGLHYPRTVVCGHDLKPGRHVVSLKVSQETQSGGHAARIMWFAAN